MKVPFRAVSSWEPINDVKRATKIFQLVDPGFVTVENKQARG
jgi:hypothetical protein